MRKQYVIATSKVWNPHIIEELTNSIDVELTQIVDKEKLNYESLFQIKPICLFFPHWSHIIPPEIFENFECIVFHMTDVPFGRGGSPLQNLIERGIYETKISAIKATKEIDAGNVLIKRKLSLYGSAEEIYIRATKIIIDMIKTIIKTKPKSTPQRGQATYFKRRKKEQSNIANLDSLEKVFDYIRMLDAEGYPHAYLETNYFKFKFTRATLKQGSILADVKIMKKDKT